MTDLKAQDYLDSFPNRPRAELNKLYPGAGDEALDFLQKTLTFNPYFRITLEDCFKHPLFAKIRKQDKEDITGSPVTLEFEKLDLDKQTLRELFIKEI